MMNNTMTTLNTFLSAEANNYFVLICFIINIVISLVLYIRLDSKHTEIANRLLNVAKNQAEVIDGTHQSLSTLANIVHKQWKIIKEFINN